jgi:hypothetical protein
MTQSRITAFYSGEAPDDRGRSLAELQAQSLDALEHNHDYIQWLFPLTERSSANPRAPLLSAADIRAFAASAVLRGNLLRSLSVMLRYYGLELFEPADGIEIRPGDTFSQRSQVWLTPYNHNFLRITRILRSLTLLGCGEHAQALFRCMADVYRQHAGIIGPETFTYWQKACGRADDRAARGP